MAITPVSANPAVSENMFGTWTNPNANLNTYNATNTPAYANLLQNPFFVQAMAGIAEGLDPEGVGGSLGRAAKGMVSSRQASKSNMTAIADSNKRHQELINALNRHGGITPRGMAGPTSVAMGPDGSITMKIDSDNPIKPGPPPSAPDRDTTNSSPSPSMAMTNRTAPVQQTSGYNGNAPSPMELAPPESVRRQQLGPVPATSIGPTRSQSYGSLYDVIPFYQAPLRSRKSR